MCWRKLSSKNSNNNNWFLRKVIQNIRQFTFYSWFIILDNILSDFSTGNKWLISSRESRLMNAIS